jgi:TPR repeat protein
MIYSEIHRTWILTLSAVLLTSCATTQFVDQGAIYYEQGLYDQAANEWSLLAHEGHYVAQHNLGLLSLDGLGTTPRSLNDAATWFFESAIQSYVPAMVSLAEVLTTLGHKTLSDAWLNHAARWGNIEAIEHLKKRGLPIPGFDLYTKHLQEKAMEKLEATGVWMRPPIRKR